MSYEIVIGLETHAQLSTASKIFSGASTAFGAAPNTQASAVDIALPGVLPVLNRGAVERAIRFGLAVGGTINQRSVFARKNYFYPDLPKGYQISQYEIPVVQGGSIRIPVDGGEKTVRLTRAHLEEDAGKSLHERGTEMSHGMSGIDLNRAGTPLLEIVSEPEMSSSDEAVAYAKALHGLVRWVGICDGNMQEGSFRCDANVSVRRPGTPLGTRCEIKNLNSFRFMQDAIDFEVRRQIALIEDGGTVVQETRLYDPDRHETRSMRSKEDAQDYRYFPDPDLPPLVVSDEWIVRIRDAMPELAEVKRKRYQDEFLLFPEDAIGLTSSREISEFFDETLEVLARIPGIPYGAQSPNVANAKSVANWILNEVLSLSNRDQTDAWSPQISPQALADLISHTDRFKKTISHKMAVDVIAQMWRDRDTAANAATQIILSRHLQQISDPDALQKIVDTVIAENPAIVAEYRAGKEKAFNSLVGKAMAATKGKANPAQVNELLKRKLGG